MKIAYVFDRPLPARETDSEQALQTLSAFARQGAEVRLVLPAQRSPRTARELASHYGVQGDFELVRVPTPFEHWPNARKWWHAARALELPAVASADVVYTRNFPTLFALARRPQAFAYETYRPWPDQFRVLRPAFRAALRSRACLGAILHSRLASDCYAGPSRAEIRAALDLPADRPLVVYTGHINLTKGLDTVFQLARRLPRALFLLVGSEGRGVVETLARQLGNIQLVPWQPFELVTRYLLAADVLLQPPSRVPLRLIGNTVLPMKIFLYLAAGRPIVAPDLPDLREVLQHDVNALLVAPGDHVAAANALERLLDEPALARRLGDAARHTAAGLTWDARAHRVLAFLEQRLSEPRGLRTAS
jgi:glycosyltransferase involved in cell wall biosynthesis